MPITCSQCGAQNEEGNFCFQCGGRLGATPQTPTPAPQQAAFPGAQSPQTPFPGAQQAQTPFPGAQPPAQPFPGSQQPYPPQAPFPGAQQAQPPFPGGHHAGAQQQFPGAYPQQQFPGGYSQPPKKSGGGKVALVIVALVVLAGGGWYAKNALFPAPVEPGPAQNTPTNPTTPTPPPTQGTPTTQNPTTPTTPANPGTPNPPSDPAGLSVTQVMNGNFRAGQAELYDANANYLVAGKGSEAWLYRFDTDGTYTQLATVNDPAAGEVLHVAVGDLNNSGTPLAVITYANELHILRADGTTSNLEQKTEKVLIGDFDGDGTKEGLFVLPQSDGRDALQVIQFGTEPKELALIGADSVPETLMHGHVRSEGKDLLANYRREGDDLVFELYQLDFEQGLVKMIEYPVTDPVDQPAQWYGTGTIYDGGAGMAVSRSGAQASIDLYALNVDEAVPLGNFKIPGGLNHAVVLGTFEGDEPRILSIDETGNFYIYKISE